MGPTLEAISRSDVLQRKVRDVSFLTTLSGEARLASTGILRVHLERGVDLVAKDWTGRSDPYADVRVAGFAQKSKKCKGTFRSVRSALNPCWDETLEFKGALHTFSARARSGCRKYYRGRLRRRRNPATLPRARYRKIQNLTPTPKRNLI